jgi:chemotaxis protein MotA
MRKISAILGTLLALVVGVMTFTTSGVDLKYFYSPLGLAIVIGGTLAAVFLSYSLTDVFRVASICATIFFRDDKGFKKIGQELMKFAEDCSNSGVPESIKNPVHPFLNDCLTLISDGYSDSEMRDMLEQRITSMYESEKYDNNIIKSIAKYPPAFGMVGTVVGLIALMATLGGDNVDMSQIGNYMAIALTTTLYGLMIANFFFKPVSDNLEIGSKVNMKVRQLVMESCLLIKNRVSLLIIQDTINSLIPPRERISSIGAASGGAKRAA